MPQVVQAQRARLDLRVFPGELEGGLESAIDHAAKDRAMSDEPVRGGLHGGGHLGIVREQVLDGRILHLGIERALVGVIVAADADARDKGKELPEFHRVDQFVVSVDPVVVVILERSIRLREGQPQPRGARLAVIEEVSSPR